MGYKVTHLIITIFLVCIPYVLSLSCLKCNSSSDPNCVDLQKQLLGQDCPNFNDTCYVRVKDGKTIRGCTNELSATEIQECKDDYYDNVCKICSTDTCNSEEKFPNHRLTCLSCSGDLNSSCALNLQVPAFICQVYDKYDKCVIYKSTKKNRLVRGCLSTNDIKDLCPNEKTCFMCDSAACNHLHANTTSIPDSATSLFFYTTNILLIVSFMIPILLK